MRAEKVQLRVKPPRFRAWPTYSDRTVETVLSTHIPSPHESKRTRIQ